MTKNLPKKVSFALVFIFTFASISCFSQDLPTDSTAHKHLKKGALHIKKKEYSKAYKELKLAEKGFLKKQDISGIAKSYLNLSSLFTYTQEQDSANFYLLKCQTEIEKVDNKSVQANIYLNIAHINYQNKDYEKALEFAHRSEDINLLLKDTIAISKTYNNLAILYRNIDNYESALDYNFKSLNLNKLSKDSVGIAKSYNNIGLIYENIGDFNQAISYYKNATALNAQIDAKNPNPYRNLGALHLRMGNYKESNDFYKKALTIEKEQNITTRLKDIYNVMLHNYIQLKDFEKAIEFQEKRDQIEIKEVENKNKKKLEALKQQQELYYKEQELKHAKAVSEKNSIIILIVSGLLIITLLFFLQSFRTSKLKRKQEQLLLERKVLRAQMNPHFIFNALSAIQNSLMDNDPLKSATFLSRFSRLIRQNFEFVNKETISLADDLDALKNYIETQQMRFNNNFTYEIDIDPQLDIDMAKIPPLLIQPFVENSIEHGFKNKDEHGLLQITIKKEQRFLHICISDNGSGFDTSKLGKGAHSFSVFKERLRLLSKAAEKSFKITSSNEGTEVQFKIGSV